MARQDVPFLVVDVRNDDFADMYSLDAVSGELRAKAGSQQARAAWSVFLLDLNDAWFSQTRKRLLEKLGLCSELLVLRAAGGLDDVGIHSLDVLLRDCAEQYLLPWTFGIAMSDAVRAELERIVERLKAEQGAASR